MKIELLELRNYMITENLGLYEMLQEIPAVDEFEQHNDFFGLSKKETINKINEKMKYAYGIDNTEENPKCEHYILFVNDKPVCIGGLMLEMTEFWQKHRGHIWYNTRPSERHKGYATLFVSLLCQKAKAFGLKKITAQCDIKNLGSNKVLEKNGFFKYKNPLCPDWDDTNFWQKTL